MLLCLRLGSLSRNEAAGVLRLNLHKELLSGHEIVWHRRGIGRRLLVDRYQRLLQRSLATFNMRCTTPKVADDSTEVSLSLLDGDTHELLLRVPI